MYAREPLLMDEERLDDQLKPIYNSYVLNPGYSLEDLPGAMGNRDWWQEKVREIRAGSAR